MRGIIRVIPNVLPPRLVTASQEGLARIWDSRTGNAVTPPLRHAGPVPHASFSPDGSRLAVGRMDGFVRLYLMNVQELVALAESRLTRTWTLDECTKFLHVDQCPQ